MYVCLYIFERYTYVFSKFMESKKYTKSHKIQNVSNSVKMFKIKEKCKSTSAHQIRVIYIYILFLGQTFTFLHCVRFGEFWTSWNCGNTNIFICLFEALPFQFSCLKWAVSSTELGTTSPPNVFYRHVSLRHLHVLCVSVCVSLCCVVDDIISLRHATAWSVNVLPTMFFIAMGRGCCLVGSGSG